MTHEKSAAAENYAFLYNSCRNISSPEDLEAGRKVYSGSAPVTSVVGLEDNENVREYLVEATGKKKKSPTLVHQAIRKTLADHSDKFAILNGGMVIVARSADVREKDKNLYLHRPSIINGSQTQGEIRRFLSAVDLSEIDVPSIKFEIIITDDDELIAEISIARNFQNDVKPISIAGRLGQLDDLETAMQRAFKGVRLIKNESDLSIGEDVIDTEKLIQVAFAMLPEDVLRKCPGVTDASNRTFSYSQKTRCLRLFQKLSDDGNEEVYEAFLQTAPFAWALYQKWKSHQVFNGSGLHSIKRDNGKTLDVPDGIVFPIVSSQSVFVKKIDGKWRFAPSAAMKDEKLFEIAKGTYIDIAKSNPQNMGKMKGCYSPLSQISAVYAELG